MSWDTGGVYNVSCAHFGGEPRVRHARCAAGLRNVLVDDYAEVDLTIVARTVANDTQDLRQLGHHIGALLPE